MQFYGRQALNLLLVQTEHPTIIKKLALAVLMEYSTIIKFNEIRNLNDCAEENFTLFFLDV